MIAALRSWLEPAGRRPRRSRRDIRPGTEALETRAVLSISITASIGGLTLPVTSVMLRPPKRVGVQEVSLILSPSGDDEQFVREAAEGRLPEPVKITLSDGEVGTDTIAMTDALISSFRLVSAPSAVQPSIVLTIYGRTEQSGSISATLNGLTLPVVSVTLPRSTSEEASKISLVVKVSQGVTTFLKDASQGKVMPEVKITLDRIGNGSTATIILKDVLISSYQFLSAGETRVFLIRLVAKQETIEIS
jgi:hypothetical protein